MLKVTLTHKIYPQFRYSNGTYPVKFRVLFKRKNSFIGTNIILTPDQLTPSLNIRDKEAQSMVDSLNAKYRKMLNRLSEEDLREMTIKDIVNYLEKGEKMKDEEKFTLDFVEYTKAFAATKIATSGKNYLSALKALTTYKQKDRIDISEIDSAFLSGFERFLADKYGQNARALSLYIGHIRTVHFLAQREFNVPEKGIYKVLNPFANYKVPRPPAPKHHDLDKNLIQRMINDRKNLNGVRKVAVDTFLLSFCLMGMNIADIYECAAPRDYVIHYFRHKTTEHREDNAETYVRIPEIIRPLYEQYKDPEGKLSFGFHLRYANGIFMTTCIDRGLRLYKADIGYEGRLSTYNARHTWATLCHAHSHNIGLINDGLVHVDPSMRVTNIYIRKSFEPVWEMNEKFLEETFDWSGLF